MLNQLFLLAGLTIWFLVLRDGFLTIVQPRSVGPLDGLSGTFYHVSWRLWSSISRRLRGRQARLSFLAIYGPLSVVLLLGVWAFLVILSFALIYTGLGDRFLEHGAESSDFATLFYMSGSTFLTLGLGDVVSRDTLGRLFMLAEAANGLIFLSLIVTYMPILDNAYAQREAGSLKMQTRAGRPVCAIEELRVYFGPGEGYTLRSGMNDAEAWFASILQSHVAHPVVAYYRAQRHDSSWLISFTLIMDGAAVLMTVGDHAASRQARATFRMGLRLLHDLMITLSVPFDHADPPRRLTEESLPTLLADLAAISPHLHFDSTRQQKLMHLNQLYDARLRALARWLVADLPGWLPPDQARAFEEREEALPWEGL